jgi:predicted kinase
MLVLVNGPPASGKSTIARAVVARRPLALCLDIDVVRSMLGTWLDRPDEAGLAARALAVAMARTHLAAGHDVVVPQFVGRESFVDELSDTATSSGARFVEIALIIDSATAIASFRDRSATPTHPTHVDAADLVARSTSADPVGEMYDRYMKLLARRPRAQRVEVVWGDVETTVARVESALPR